MRHRWRSSYKAQTRRYLKKHFGSSQRITTSFPYMKADFVVKGNPDVADPRALLKTNNEYHGIERHAKQYFAVAMYEEAAEFWLLAAAWRLEVVNAEGKQDKRHQNAVEFAIKNYKYSRALLKWQKHTHLRTPEPEDFDLSSEILDKKEEQALSEIDAAYREKA